MTKRKMKFENRAGKKWNIITEEELEKKHIGDIKSKEIIFLCTLGRLVKDKKPFSFNCIVHSTSSAGKDHLVKSVLDLFPKSDIECYGRLSAKALNYLHNKEDDKFWTYDGKVLYLEEIEENTLNNEVMRVFTAGTTKSAIVKDKEILILEVEGKPVVFVTTATTIPTEEIMNRFMVVKLDESDEQTKRTFLNEEVEYSDEIKEFLRNLKPQKVEIPTELVRKIANVFPVKVSSRRNFQRFMDWIKAVTLFNQADRQGTTDTITATDEDYDIAKEVYMNAYSGVADFPLKLIDKKIIKAIEIAGIPLSIKEISNSVTYISHRGMYPHLENLTNKGILTTFELRDTFNNALTKYDLSDEYKNKQPIKLPNSIDLCVKRVCNEGNEGNEGNVGDDGNEVKNVDSLASQASIASKASLPRQHLDKISEKDKKARKIDVERVASDLVKERWIKPEDKEGWIDGEIESRNKHGKVVSFRDNSKEKGV